MRNERALAMKAATRTLVPSSREESPRRRRLSHPKLEKGRKAEGGSTQRKPYLHPLKRPALLLVLAEDQAESGAAGPSSCSPPHTVRVARRGGWKVHIEN